MRVHFTDTAMTAFDGVLEQWKTSMDRFDGDMKRSCGYIFRDRDRAEVIDQRGVPEPLGIGDLGLRPMTEVFVRECGAYRSNAYRVWATGMRDGPRGGC